MGGGMSGGMGGGSRGGGRSGGMGGGRGAGMERMPSPADAIKETLEQSNPLKLLLDHRKPLSLTGAQRDTLDRYRDELKDAQKPVFKALESVAASMPRGRGRVGRIFKPFSNLTIIVRQVEAAA